MSDKKEKAKAIPRTSAEWVSLIVSLLLLAAVVGVIVVLWVQDAGKPATFRVDTGTIRRVGPQYYLPITIRNDGDATGASVSVEGRLTGQKDDQTVTTTFDFIPAHASAEGVLVFPSDPSPADVRVVSFQPP
jgi:uncharacterized protein (TIGR02588 family)